MVWRVEGHARVLPFFAIGLRGITSPTLVDDMLFLDVLDDYQGLNHKTASMIGWALRYPFAQFWKCDDDTYVHVPRWLELINRGGDYIGSQCPISGGKFPFAGGGDGYLLSRRAAEIVAEGLGNDCSSSEDVRVADALGHHGILVAHDNGLGPIDQCGNPRYPQPNNEMITAHPARDNTMDAIHAVFHIKHNS